MREFGQWNKFGRFFYDWFEGGGGGNKLELDENILKEINSPKYPQSENGVEQNSFWFNTIETGRKKNEHKTYKWVKNSLWNLKEEFKSKEFLEISEIMGDFKKFSEWKRWGDQYTPAFIDFERQKLFELNDKILNLNIEEDSWERKKIRMELTEQEKKINEMLLEFKKDFDKTEIRKSLETKTPESVMAYFLEIQDPQEFFFELSLIKDFSPYWYCMLKEHIRWNMSVQDQVMKKMQSFNQKKVWKRGSKEHFQCDTIAMRGYSSYEVSVDLAQTLDVAEVKKQAESLIRASIYEVIETKTWDFYEKEIRGRSSDEQKKVVEKKVSKIYNLGKHLFWKSLCLLNDTKAFEGYMEEIKYIGISLDQDGGKVREILEKSILHSEKQQDISIQELEEIKKDTTLTSKEKERIESEIFQRKNSLQKINESKENLKLFSENFPELLEKIKNNENIGDVIDDLERYSKDVSAFFEVNENDTANMKTIKERFSFLLLKELEKNPDFISDENISFLEKIKKYSYENTVSKIENRFDFLQNLNLLTDKEIEKTQINLNNYLSKHKKDLSQITEEDLEDFLSCLNLSTEKKETVFLSLKNLVKEKWGYEKKSLESLKDKYKKDIGFCFFASIKENPSLMQEVYWELHPSQDTKNRIHEEIFFQKWSTFENVQDFLIGKDISISAKKILLDEWKVYFDLDNTTISDEDLFLFLKRSKNEDISEVFRDFIKKECLNNFEKRRNKKPEEEEEKEESKGEDNEKKNKIKKTEIPQESQEYADMKDKVMEENPQYEWMLSNFRNKEKDIQISNGKIILNNKQAIAQYTNKEELNNVLDALYFMETCGLDFILPYASIIFREIFKRSQIVRVKDGFTPEEAGILLDQISYLFIQSEEKKTTRNQELINKLKESIKAPNLTNKIKIFKEIKDTPRLNLENNAKKEGGIFEGGDFDGTLFAEAVENNTGIQSTGMKNIA